MLSSWSSMHACHQQRVQLFYTAIKTKPLHNYLLHIIKQEPIWLEACMFTVLCFWPGLTVAVFSLTIIIIITRMMFTVLLSTWAIARVYPVHLMNTYWAPGGCQPSDHHPNLGCESTATIPSHHRHLFMVALCNRETIYIFMLFLLLSFFFLLFFSSPNLSGRKLDVYHTLAHGVALVRI